MFSSFVSTSVNKQKIIETFFKEDKTNILFKITPDFNLPTRPKNI